MTSFYALPDASQNAQSQARQADIQKAVEEAQRAVEAATREAVAAQQQAQAAAAEAEAAQRAAQGRAGTTSGQGTIVIPGDGDRPDVSINVDRSGIHVTQGDNHTTIPIQDVVPRGAVQISYAVSAALIAVAIVGPLLRFFLRRFERRQATGQLSAGVQARLDAMERNIDTVAVELERVSEGQRFTNRLLEQRPLSMPSVLIVDDEPNIRRMVGALLGAEGYDVRDAADGSTGLAMADALEPDVALVDLMMPGDLDGLALLARLRERRPDLPVVMMSGRAALTDAVRATKLGAFTFLEKPLTPEGVLLALASAFELRQARRAAQALREDLGISGEMVGDSPVMRDVRAMIARVGPTEARVLITGESGTGKELVAAALHLTSARRDRPFVRVNCAAIPRDLVESEMFGHERGAFTGATERRIGRFELAHTGTLFLDEVGDLHADAQAKLLRAIEAREIERVGGGKPVKVDVRILAATNKDLTKAVADGSFREDLFFRLNVIPIALPPLRDRPGDLPALVRHFADRHRTRTGQPLVRWAGDALAAFADYRWPGNVRELANIVERLAILHAGSEIGAREVRGVLPSIPSNGDAYSAAAPAAPDLPLSDALDAYERRLIAAALALGDGNVAEAARRLQTDRPNLYRRMRRLGLA